jgi:hypothetical protein
LSNAKNPSSNHFLTGFVGAGLGLGATGTDFTTNGCLGACSVPWMTWNPVFCLTAFTTFLGFALMYHGFFGGVGCWFYNEWLARGVFRVSH